MAHITGTNLCSVEAASSLRAHTPHTRTVSRLQPLPLTGHCVAPSLAVNPLGHWNELHVGVGTATKQRLQSSRTEVVLPQVVVAVYEIAGDEDAPYCFPVGTSAPHVDGALVVACAQQKLSVHSPVGQTVLALVVSGTMFESALQV